MILFKIIFFVSFILTSELFSQELIDDDTYYEKGVKFYDEGDFKKSFIVFLIYRKRVTKTQYIIFLTCILKVLELRKIFIKPLNTLGFVHSMVIKKCIKT